MDSLLGQQHKYSTYFAYMYCKSTHIFGVVFPGFAPCDSNHPDGKRCLGQADKRVVCILSQHDSSWQNRRRKVCWLQINYYYLKSLQSALWPEDRMRLDHWGGIYIPCCRVNLLTGINLADRYIINIFPLYMKFRLKLTWKTRHSKICVCVCVRAPSKVLWPAWAGHWFKHQLNLWKTDVMITCHHCRAEMKDARGEAFAEVEL